LHGEARERLTRVSGRGLDDDAARLRRARSLGANDEPSAAFLAYRKTVRYENLAGELEGRRGEGFRRHRERSRQQATAVNERRPGSLELLDYRLNGAAEQRAYGLRSQGARREQ
jgi:hypothetical protein